MRPLDFRAARHWDTRRRGSRRWRNVGIVVVVLTVLAAVGAGVQVLRGAPPARVALTLPSTGVVAGPPPALPWPAAGQATVGVLGVGTLGSVRSTAPAPIASLTKIMTAWVILHDHPLTLTTQGPPIAFTAADVANYQTGAAQGQSVVKVLAGESLSERQSLDALLVGSANDVAIALAAWDAGSQAAFVARMNADAVALGMTRTHYSDAVGLDAGSVSTATDQVALATKAMEDPVFAAIVAQPQINLPVAGTVFNYDYLVGHDGIVGVKTGSTGVAGGCFVFAAHRVILGHDRVVIGAVLGQRGASELQAALGASKALIDAVPPLVRAVTVLPPGPVGRVTTRWGSTAEVATTKPV
ncbi:MAG TPA: hypothetical protein VFH45_01155, partial [Acidimicrobiales bacterium]|nr:hypothetical protein [Acidimicrobiales bacterium]